eukprot:1148384-Pelagomonas_calceolata.AAC.1
MPILYNLRTNLPLPGVPLKLKTRIITLVPWSSVLPETHLIHINFPPSSGEGDSRLFEPMSRHPDVGIVALRPHSQQMVRNRNHKRPERFNNVCTARKTAFLIALKAGQAKHACEQLHREYGAEAQRAK